MLNSLAHCDLTLDVSLLFVLYCILQSFRENFMKINCSYPTLPSSLALDHWATTDAIVLLSVVVENILPLPCILVSEQQPLKREKKL